MHILKQDPPPVETYVFSRATRSRQSEARAYLQRFIGYPDEGSEFDQKIGWGKHLFRLPLFGKGLTLLGTTWLRRQGYDVLMLLHEPEVIGYTAFQTHADKSLHVFSVYVEKPYRKQGLATTMQTAILDEARVRETRKVRLSKGGDEALRRIYANFSEREEELEIKILGDYWLEVL